ncbi:M23 family metallopeptidase [Nocardioides sp. TRM66260-LWL]|uniref:M23 family metallopeptidase n=1 Tax=Nocardioides sp. TRM66260-LWL TaxID=2874478 RepID=UPI001CC6EABC|nr:M23 family metallopeptidase [Nocardioides sp. TRM66260-LWL]MBZ5733228.1 M23 family metallopeptidase [Nocardioides sp. TRM66260-LWL]
MGNDRADSSTRPDPSPAPYVGKRARAVAPDAVQLAPVTPYVGRRVARPAPEAAQPAPAAPSTASPVLTLPRTATPLDPTSVFDGPRPVVVPDVPLTRTDRVRPEPPAPYAPVRSGADAIDTVEIARVLAGLAPVDHSTSFASDDTEIVPLRPQPEPVATLVGGRRAARREPVASPFVRRLPSVQLAAGVAVLGVAVTGAAFTAGDDTGVPTVSVAQISALGGTSGTATVRDREVVSRASDPDLRGSDAIAGDLADRNQRLQSVEQQADARAQDLKANRWVLPVSPGAYRLTARFGETGLWASYHTGLDFAAPPGTPLYAIAAATVTETGPAGPYGNRTILTLADGTELWYCHQTEIQVSVGQKVTPGQQIGTVGSTGHVTGPHLHLEVRPGAGDPVDPYPALVQHGVTP